MDTINAICAIRSNKKNPRQSVKSAPSAYHITQNPINAIHKNFSNQCHPFHLCSNRHNPNPIKHPPHPNFRQSNKIRANPQICTNPRSITSNPINATQKKCSNQYHPYSKNHNPSQPHPTPTQSNLSYSPASSKKHSTNKMIPLT